MSSPQTIDQAGQDNPSGSQAALAADVAAEPRGLRRELLPLAVCVAVGLAMAMLPPLVQWLRIGRLIWIGNGDELYMLALGSRAYHSHPGFLSDPVFAADGASLFRQLPLLPGIWVAWLLQLGPGGIDNAWRILGGAALGAAWYVLIRQLIPGRWVAAALSSILLTDLGLLGGGLFFRQAQALVRLLTNSPRLIEGPFLHSQWRVATPLPTLAFLLLHLWLTIRARQRSSPLRLVLSGIGVGLLFHVYPYYWTAAGVALGLGLLLDRGHRGVYFWPGVLGLLIGVPRLAWDYMLKRDTGTEWLIRTDKLVHFSRLSDLKPPLVAILVLMLGFWWVWARRRDLLYLWCLGTAGLILFKNHIITGFNLENYHWYYVWGPCCSLLLLLLLVAAFPRRGRGAKVAVGLLLAASVADSAAGLVLRGAEAVRAPEGLFHVQAWSDYQAQRVDTGVPRLVPNAMVGGENRFIDMAAIVENQRPLEDYWVYLSPYVSDAEWYERLALNAILMGQDRAAFEVFARERFAVRPPDRPSWGPWTRDPADSRARIEAVLAAFDAAAANLDPALDRLGVRYVGLRVGARNPALLADGRWALLQDGPIWRVWERKPTPGR